MHLCALELRIENLGPGEPLLTVARLLEENHVSNVALEGTDSSKGMVAIAKQRLNKTPIKNVNVEFKTSTVLSNLDHYNIITSSLVLPYMSDKRELLKSLYTSLDKGGLLISCHWPHPSQVPFLSLLKRVNVWIGLGKLTTIADLETDVSFSCNNEEQTKALFREQGFAIEQYLSVPIPMTFPDIRTLLSFSRVAPWFNDDNLYPKAENETKRLLREDYGIEIKPNEPLQLTNYAVVVVASKQ